MLKSIINTRVKILIFILFILSLIFYLSRGLLPRVVSVTPGNNAINIPMETTITIRFNTPVNSNQVKVKFEPPIEYTFIDAQDPKELILKPNFALTEDTEYIVTVTKPLSFSTQFTTIKLAADQVQGQNYLYRKENAVITQQLQQQQPYWDNITNFRNKLPFQNNNFLIRYDLRNDVYLVTLKDQNTAAAKAAFLNWLKSQNITTNSVTILFTNSLNSNFYVLSNDFTYKSVGLNSPISMTFSQSVDTSHFQITLSPNIPAEYDWDTNKKKLVITPVQEWGFGQSYTITIGGNSISQSGEKLDKEYSLGFKCEGYIGQ